VETAGDLQARLGVVCVENNGACINKSLTPDSYEEARSAASPLAGPRNLTIQYQLTGRTIPCSMPAGGLVHAQIPLPSKFQRPGFAPPALGLFIGEATAAGDCKLLSIPEDEQVAVEALVDGTTYRGLIPKTGSSLLSMDADPDFFRTDYIIDEPGDNSSGKDDIEFVRFGLLKNGLAPGNTMLIKVPVRNLQETGTAQIEFSFTNVGPGALDGPSLLPPSFLLKVLCSKKHESCRIAETSPSSVGPLVKVEGVIPPVESGVTYVLLELDFTGVGTAALRIRAGVANGYDYAPDLQPQTWTYPGSGNSFRVDF
jgi:hypothetical protein